MRGEQWFKKVFFITVAIMFFVVNCNRVLVRYYT